MLPANGFLNTDFIVAKQPSHTFFLDVDYNAAYGYTDGAGAMKQAIYLILETERYQHVIFSRNYGTELISLIGQPMDFVLPELKRRITEAMLQDSRIQRLDGFDFDIKKRNVTVAFTAVTIFGPIPVEKEVAV